MSMDPGAYILCILIAVTFAVFTVIAFAIEETGAERIGAYFDRQFGEVRSKKKTSVPGPRGNAGDPARHGGMLPCPVAATPDVANSTHIEPPRAGGVPNMDVYLYSGIAVARAEQIEQQRRDSWKVTPFWQAARTSRITAEEEARRADADRWPHLMRTWSFDTNTFPAIREEAAA